MNNKTKVELIAAIMSEAWRCRDSIKEDDDYDGDTMHGYYVGVLTAMNAVLKIEGEDDG